MLSYLILPYLSLSYILTTGLKGALAPLLQVEMSLLVLEGLNRHGVEEYLDDCI